MKKYLIIGIIIFITVGVSIVLGTKRNSSDESLFQDFMTETDLDANPEDFDSTDLEWEEKPQDEEQGKGVLGKTDTKQRSSNAEQTGSSSNSTNSPTQTQGSTSGYDFSEIERELAEIEKELNSLDPNDFNWEE